MVNKILCVSLLMLILASCSVKTIKDFYVLSYLPGPESLERFRVTGLPIDARVQVQNFEMNRIYDRNSIVVRESLHKLSFDEKSNWALRPDRALPELVINHINSANIFKECKSDYALTSPDYFITGTINNIEIYNGEGSVMTHLNLNMEFRDKDRKILVSKRIDLKKEIRKYDITLFVKTIGDALSESVHEFLVETVDYFKTLEKQKTE